MHATALHTAPATTTDPDLAAIIVRDHTRLEAAAAGVRVLVPGGDVGLADAVLGAIPAAELHLADAGGRELFDAVVMAAAADGPTGWITELRTLWERVTPGGRLTAVLSAARNPDAVSIPDLVGLADVVIDHGGWTRPADHPDGVLVIWMDRPAPRRRRTAAAGEEPLFAAGS